MMLHAGLHEILKTDIWPKFEATTNKLENIMVGLQEEKCAYEKFYSKMLDYTQYLNTFE